MNPTHSERVRQAFALTRAIAEAIHDLREVPASELYAQICGQIDLDSFQGIIRCLMNAGLVSDTAHLLRWIGPRVTVERAPRPASTQTISA